MFCRKCGTELDTTKRLENGTVRCSGCGALYRPKVSSSSTRTQDRTSATLPRRSDNSSYASRRARSRFGSAHTVPRTAHTNTNSRLRSFKPMVALIMAIVVIVSAVAVTTTAIRNGTGISVFESSEEKGLKKLLSRLQSAYNSQDIYGIIQCFDPSLSDATFGMMKLLGVSDAFKSIIPFASKVVGASGIVDNSSWGKCNLSIVEYSVDDSKGSLTYQVSLTYTDGTKNTFNDTANVMMVDGTWYFSAFQPVNAATVEYGSIPVNPTITEADVQGELFPIKQNLQYGYVNESGMEIVSPYFRGFKGFVGNLCAVSMDNQKWGFIDRSGNLIINYTITGLGEPAGCGYYYIKNDDGIGLYNPETGATISTSFESLGSLTESGLIPAKKTGYWGLIDLNENIVVDYRYTAMDDSFGYNSIGVAVNGAWGVIDRTGNFILPLSSDRNKVKISDAGLIFCDDCIYNRDGSLWFSDAYYYDFHENGWIIARIRNGSNLQYNDTRYGHDRTIVFSPNGDLIVDSDNIISTILTQHSEEVSEGIDYAEINIIDSSPKYCLVTLSLNGNYNFFNVVSTDGRLLLNDWIFEKNNGHSYYIVDDKSGIISVYGSNDGEGGIQFYDLISGSLIGELAIPSVWFSDETIGDSLIFYWHEGLSRKVYIIPWGDFSNYQVFSSIERYENAAIVFDGIYYGLLVGGDFIGQGLSYTSIDYNQGLQIFTLNAGSNSEKYRIGANGTINRL